MQTDHNANDGRSASFSRRNFLQIAAATLPAVAEAGSNRQDDVGLIPLTDEQQLDACIGQLKNILARMHPEFSDVYGGYSRLKLGGAAVIIEARWPIVEWSGPGLYEILSYHRDGIDGIYRIDRHWSEMDARFDLWGGPYKDGNVIAPRVIISPDRLLRKLDGVRCER